jgi:creatinine amidohydrolase/Fe(II)-dependent formamide hydrolase-like protein/sterol desaturase/sphingolipid hydroxylase (fatty acid hydroxylase superfamily)
MSSFSDVTTFLLQPFLLVKQGSERIYWLYLFTSLLLALLVFLKSNRGQGFSWKKLSAFCFPASIYGHRSARNDYVFFWVNSILSALMILPIVGRLHGLVSNQIQNELSQLGLFGLSGNHPMLGSVLYTLCAGILLDFLIFYIHYLQHRVPWLWEFHKTHHSAEVLQPLTVYRMHPVDDILNFILSGLLLGLLDGLFRGLFHSPLIVFGAFNINILLMGFYLAGYHLRHSHIWLDYGPFWDRLFISPAQHQIHHSQAPNHYDKNFGFLFALWDRWFGTLYIPKAKEPLQFGINHAGEHLAYDSVWKLYLLPFQKAFALLNPTRQKHAWLAIFGFCLLFGGTIAFSHAPGQTDSVFLDDLTWMEVQDKLQAGYTIAIVPTGGTEQNGPHMVLGKHNFIVRRNAGEIARLLGNALVTPVLPYVPEGDTEPPTQHMQYPGTLTLPENVFEEVLESTAHSLKAHGFKLICFVGDSGGNQEGQEKVAKSLTAAWKKDGIQVLSVDDYYYRNGQTAWLKTKGYSEAAIGSHAGIRDTSELWAVHAEGIRRDELMTGTAANQVKTGVLGDATQANPRLGNALLQLKIKAAIRQIRTAVAEMKRSSRSSPQH